MNNEEMLQAVTVVFRDVLDLPDLTLSPATTAGEVEAWDSLSHVQLVVAVEKRFQVRFTAKEIQSFTCVGDMIECTSRKMVK
jgi:acyl carrier protein